jgi:methionyl-tRNA formyltransferase
MDEKFFRQYEVFLSLHCKQLFPEKLVRNHRCVNIHPGFNPYNRGWFPQVFSIINKKPVGVTIHEMDEELDHGSILYQEKIDIKLYDTSWSVYHRIQQKEVELLEKYLLDIIEKRYNKKAMLSEGNINYKSDFEKICRIDLSKQATYGEVIDLLRATTFDGYDNAYFMDDDGNKIYVNINLKKETRNAP